jgi:Cof subfamily protein (haloacid dehalogenase superfamily)
MGKFDGYLVCTDCDGTLTDRSETISDKNISAIKYFQDNGGLFTVSTGRYPDYSDKFDDFTPNTFIVADNGSVLYDGKNKKIVLSRSLDGPVLDVLYYIYDEMPEVWAVNICGISDMIGHYVQNLDSLPEEMKDWLKEENKLKDRSEIEKKYNPENEEISKIVLIQPSSIARKNMQRLREKYGNYFNFNMSWPEGVEMIPKGAGKGEMIREMKKMLGNISTTVGIGDYDNDISMLRLCDIGYAVENATEEVKEAADRITVSCDNSAIAKVIEDLESDANKIGNC